jgi:CheY-like chemotaxis protein
MSVAVASSLNGEAKEFRRADGQKRRVLYAEDQSTARIVTTALLERMGFDVEAVEDGELAFEKAKLNIYDVILLDIEMPVMDGVTAARNIRASVPHCAQTPILALSAFLADSTEHSVWRDAFDSALPKPANSNELQKAMRKVLAQKQSISEVPSWSMLANNLPAGTLLMLKRAASKELNHLILAYGSCLEAGDRDTAGHCVKAIKSVAASFELTKLTQLLSRHADQNTKPSASEMLALAQGWHVQ